jgi:hypothetical protein
MLRANFGSVLYGRSKPLSVRLLTRSPSKFSDKQKERFAREWATGKSLKYIAFGMGDDITAEDLRRLRLVMGLPARKRPGQGNMSLRVYVHNKYKDAVRKRARERGMSLSTYVGKLILRDIGFLD